MGDSATTQEFWLGAWHVQPSLGRVSDGQQEIHLEPRVMRVLELLAEAGGQLVTREALFDGVWPNQVVSDEALSSLISRLRRQLGDNPRQAQLISTVPKKGYRLLQTVRWKAEPQECTAAPLDTSIEQATQEPIQRRGRRKSDFESAATPSPSSWLSSTGLVGLLTVTIVFAVLAWVQRSPTNESSEQLGGFPVNAAVPASVAVLPFDNMSPSPDDAYFSDGIAEELLNQLAGVEGLKVASRTSSFQYRGNDEDVRTIGAELSVSNVLEGSVRRDGQQLRVTVQLIDAQTGYHRWSKTYDALWQDILIVQQAITAAVVKQIKPQLMAEIDRGAVAGAVTDAKAYELYLLGRHYWHQRTAESLARSVELFEQAAAVQPDFALAYTGLAESHLMSLLYGDGDPRQAQAKAEILLQKALALGPNLAETRLALGNLYRVRTQWVDAEQELLAAVELNPNLAMAHMSLGNVYIDTGKLVPAYAQYRKALSLSPLHATVLLNLTEGALKLGLTKRAEAYLTRAEQVFPSHTFLFGLRTVIYQSEGDRDTLTRLVDEWQSQQKGTALEPNQHSRNEYLTCGSVNAFLERYQQARACLEPLVIQTESGGLSPKYRMMALSHLALLEKAEGNVERATRLCEQAIAVGVAARQDFPNDETLAYEMGGAHAVIGNHDIAVDLMQESVALGGRHLGFIRHDPRLRSLRSLAQFEQLTENLERQQASERAEVLAVFPESGIAAN